MNITNQHLNVLKKIYEDLKERKALPNGVVKFDNSKGILDVVFELERHGYVSFTSEIVQDYHSTSSISNNIVVEITSQGQDMVLRTFYSGLE